MGNKKVSETTTNRGEFNRAYKDYLAHRSRKGISCSYCKYHRNENGAGRKYYSGYYKTNGHLKMTYPNWKLVSKNPKQWMEKPIKKTIKYYGGYQRTFITINW
jgi:hypothetical protein